MFDKLVIIGVGLIGGSAALAARRAGLARQIVGAGRSGEALHEALRLGVIDAAATPVEAVKDADFVLLAMPVGRMPEVMRSIAPHLPAHAVVTDAGSTKADVVAAARAHMGDRLPRFVPAHPIAGAEKSGVQAARTELFDHKNVVLTPLPENDADAIANASAFWQGCGAKVSSMTTEAHDQIFAAVSHLPHVLAFALVEEISRRPNAEQLFGFAAGGFRDFSRIAGSSPEMWRDICLANRDAMLHELDAYIQRLAGIQRLIEANDGTQLAELFEHARNARTAWADKFQSNK
ncbi:bifunctional prephenate dehydrogenase/3-phosphoshikimate 1-carboxyvinyltransferase [mine drainage metagenome]|uniref:Bifunctional prephenate dehydrogenase/3-phosphoshikimate 1-carboxyvinyltransferase n=1 Tax=mine drainage metagenome TaxID=410659 RepID=A0A1J5RG39_9ZZZZ